jgi:hypothetical protein
MRGLTFFSHVEITCLTASFQYEVSFNKTHKTDLTSPLFLIEVPVASQESLCV